MTEQTLKQIAATLHCDSVQWPDRLIDTALTDSRSLVAPATTLFFALRTPNNDGHRFIPELIRRGVKAFVVEELPQQCPAADVDFLLVEDSLLALQALAAAHRAELGRDCTVIAVAGSRGKTMVKEGLYHLLAPLAATQRSPWSYNSRIGVPLTLLDARPDTEYLIVEAGVSTQGEMEALRRMIRPDVVVYTGVNDTEHAAGFDSPEAKAAEKALLAVGARAVLFPADDALLASKLPPQAEHYPVEMPSEADFAGRNAALCAAAAALVTGQDITSEPLAPIRTRLDVTEGVNSCLIVTDRFTCDVDSLGYALDFAMRHSGGVAPVVIMDELAHPGELAPAAYRRLGELLRHRGIERFIGIGESYQEYSEHFEGYELMRDLAEFQRELPVTNFDHATILCKGPEGGTVNQIAEQFRLRHHETVLEVNLDALVHNFNMFRAMVKPTTGVVAMVKASGYGAGSFELAKVLQNQGAAYLAVAVTDEGAELRRAGISMPIMVLNPKVTNYTELFANRLEPEVFSFDMLSEIIREGERRGVTDFPVHVKFDTGMHRLGFLREDIPALCALLRRQRVVRVRSVFSHLATADCLDMDDYTLAQLRLFTAICSEMREHLGHDFLRHILNSAGIARFPDYQFDMVRLGISLYGVDTLGLPQTRGIRTVSSLRTIVISVKHWPQGTAIGYGRRTILDHDAVIATIPVGYADGLNRRLSNGTGTVLVRGVRCPIAGNICMDACMVDVTALPDCRPGDAVEIFGENLPVDDVAATLGTIPYELLTAVSPRVKRVYYRE